MTKETELNIHFEIFHTTSTLVLLEFRKHSQMCIKGIHFCNQVIFYCNDVQKRIVRH